MILERASTRQLTAFAADVHRRHGRPEVCIANAILNQNPSAKSSWYTNRASSSHLFWVKALPCYGENLGIANSELAERKLERY